MPKPPAMPQFDVIYADPPWQWEAWSSRGEGRSAKRHYPTQKNSWITELPVRNIAAPNSLLFLWGIDPMQNLIPQVMAEWGFTFTTVGFYWVKLNKSWQQTAFRAMLAGDGILVLDDLERLFSVGLGYHTRANAEVCFIGTRGKGLHRVQRDIRRMVFAPRGRHSAKPAEVRLRIEKLYGRQRRVELFAREKVKGWSAFGNQVAGGSDLVLEDGLFSRAK